MGIVNDLHAWIPSVLRGGRGVFVTSYNRENPPRPEELLELYEYEACPYCRKVREAMTELDLAFITRVSPKGAKEKREFVKARGGKEQFPYLVDPNTGRELYESEEIIAYLYKTYGKGARGVRRLISPVNTASSLVASAARPRGSRVRAGFEEREQPEELLILYGFEASPFCRKVREKLNELNLDYEQRNVAKKSTRRPELVERGGKMMVPYLIDPNKEREMYESDDIVAYLEEVYGS